MDACGRGARDTRSSRHSPVAGSDRAAGRRGRGCADALAFLARRRANGVDVPRREAPRGKPVGVRATRIRKDSVVTSTPHVLDDFAWREPDRRQHRSRRDASSNGRRASDRLLRLRSDRTQPAPGQPGADPRVASACRTPAIGRWRWLGERPASSATRRRTPSANSTTRRSSPAGSSASRVRSSPSSISTGAAQRTPAVMANNLDWTANLSAIDLLRDIGKHFRVNRMLAKDAVSARLNSDAGISYTEFSYQILQGMDFLELYRRYGCTMQTGGATSGATSPPASTSSTASSMKTLRCTRWRRLSSPKPTARSSERPSRAPSGSTRR